MIAAFGSGVAFSLVSGMAGGGNPLQGAFTTGVFFAIFQGAFHKVCARRARHVKQAFRSWDSLMLRRFSQWGCTKCAGAYDSPAQLSPCKCTSALEHGRNNMHVRRALFGPTQWTLCALRHERMQPCVSAPWAINEDRLSCTQHWRGLAVHANSVKRLSGSAPLRLLTGMPQIGQRFSGAKKDAPEYARGNYLLRTLGMQARNLTLRVFMEVHTWQFYAESES